MCVKHGPKGLPGKLAGKLTAGAERAVALAKTNVAAELAQAQAQADEQRRIADTLEAISVRLDELNKKLERVVELHERLAQPSFIGTADGKVVAVRAGPPSEAKSSGDKRRKVRKK